MLEKEKGLEKGGVREKPVLEGLEKHLPHRPWLLSFDVELKETPSSPL